MSIYKQMENVQKIEELSLLMTIAAGTAFIICFLFFLIASNIYGTLTIFQILSLPYAKHFTCTIQNISLDISVRLLLYIFF